MTDDPSINELLTAPLVIARTKHERFWDVVQKVCAVISVIALATAVVTIVLVFQLAVCTNTNLGQRSAPSQKDALAHIAYATSQGELAKAQNVTSSALFKLLTAPKDDQASDYAQFITAFAASQIIARKSQAATDAYTDQLTADQAARNSHPLGKC